MLVLPTSLELLCVTTAAFGKACIAHLAVVCQDLPARSFYCFCHFGSCGSGNALVTLAMVVSTYIEYRVVFTIPPANQLCISTGEREEIIFSFSRSGALMNLSIKPTAADNSRRFQKFRTACGTHLAADDTL